VEEAPVVRVAVVGAGRWGPNLIANFQELGRSEVRWVVDSAPDRLGDVSKRWPELRVGTRPHDAIADPEIDAVVIATPTASHFELAREALQADKHVLVEKPMTATEREARELCALAQTRERTLMVGHVFVYNAASQRAKEALAAGELGRIYYISMVRTNLGPIRADVNAAWDLAAHDIALASYWLESDPESISGTGGAWINQGVEDTVFATIRYPGEVLVQLHASWLHPRKARDVTVVGEKKMLTFDDMNVEEPLRIYDKHVGDERTRATLVDSFESFRMSVVDGPVTTPEVTPSQPLRNECEHFLDAIGGSGRMLSGPREGLAVVCTLEALDRSLAAGGKEMPIEVQR